MRVRKQRAETIRDLRSRMQNLAVEEQTNEAKDSLKTSRDTNTCPAPVAPSPLRSNAGNSRWIACRQDQPVQIMHRQRRLSQTRSPMPLKIRTTDEGASNSSSASAARRPVLSPLRTNTRLPLGAQQSPSIMTPNANRHIMHSPLPTPRRAKERSPFFCRSPTIASMGNDENQYINNSSNRRGRLTPTKRLLSPTDRTTTPNDKPLSMPKRLRTPPSTSMGASRMF